MQHVKDIENLITILLASKKFHMLAITGAPGWAKSYTVQSVLESINRPYINGGSYVTPLGLYNLLHQNPDEVILLDDTGGLLQSDIGLSILNAATWSVGSNPRLVKWTSNSKSVDVPCYAFNGKIIALANRWSRAGQMETVISRSLHYQINVDADFVKSTFKNIATQPHNGYDVQSVEEASDFLLSLESTHDISRFNLRTLDLALDYLSSGIPNWRSLLAKSLPRPSDSDVIGSLSRSGAPIKEQLRSFQELTGKSRRTFFNLRKSLRGRELECS